MKKFWDLKKAFSNLEIEGQGRGIKRVWGWFVPKNFQGLHFLFSESLSWRIAIWTICPWNKIEEKAQCDPVLKIFMRFWLQTRKSKGKIKYLVDTLQGLYQISSRILKSQTQRREKNTIIAGHCRLIWILEPTFVIYKV